MNFRQLNKAFKELGLESGRPVLVHATVASLGKLKGGPETLLGALLRNYETVLAPTFTHKTLVTPTTGPDNNAIEYGSNSDLNNMSEIFFPNMPVDKSMGVFAETLRKHKESSRSTHPILSFAGINAEKYLNTQSLSRPLAPIAALSKNRAYIMLIGVGHTRNFSIHLGEHLARRKTFTRWALVSDMVAECPGYPPCSRGFNSVLPYISPFIHFAKVGDAEVQVMEMHVLIRNVQSLISSNPSALLCEKEGCPRCDAVRAELE